MNKMITLESKNLRGLNPYPVQILLLNNEYMLVYLGDEAQGIRVLECLLHKHGDLSSNLGSHRKSYV